MPPKNAKQYDGMIEEEFENIKKSLNNISREISKFPELQKTTMELMGDITELKRQQVEKDETIALLESRVAELEKCSRIDTISDTKPVDTGDEISEDAEKRWREAMAQIFKQLDDSEYKKMLSLLEKHGFTKPQQITAKFKEKLPENLIKKYGLVKSVSLVSEVMQEIPRNDAAVQNLLLRFQKEMQMDS